MEKSLDWTYWNIHLTAESDPGHSLLPNKIQELFNPSVEDPIPFRLILDSSGKLWFELGHSLTLGWLVYNFSTQQKPYESVSSPLNRPHLADPD